MQVTHCCSGWLCFLEVAELSSKRQTLQPTLRMHAKIVARVPKELFLAVVAVLVALAPGVGSHFDSEHCTRTLPEFGIDSVGKHAFGLFVS